MATTYKREDVLNLMDNYRKRLEEKIEYARAARQEEAENALNALLAQDIEDIAQRKAARLLASIDNLRDKAENGDRDAAYQAALEFYKATKGFDSGFFHWSDDRKWEKGLKTSSEEENAKHELKQFDARRKLVEKSTDGEFTLTALEKIGVIRYMR